MAPEMFRLMRTSRTNVGRGTTSMTTMAITAGGNADEAEPVLHDTSGDDSGLRTGRSLAA